MINKRKYCLLVLGILMFPFALLAQDLTCDDFKTGTFYILSTEQLEKITVVSNDSINEINIPRDKKIEKAIIIRKKKTQIEWKNGLNKGKPDYIVIEWIDDCTYRSTYDSSKMDLDEDKRWFNKNNGIIVSKVKIEGRCMLYKATMTTTDGQKISQNGKLCKE
ncbi:MAG: hypothetical protein JXR05_17070 [Flavobacteriaceae bacterium]